MSDLIFFAGGECLERHGSLVWRQSLAQDVAEDVTRAGTVGTAANANGTLIGHDANTARVEWIDGVPYLEVEVAATNLVTSDDVTAWTQVGTPTITSSVDDPAGGTGAYTIDDADGAVNEFVYRVVAFGSDGQKVVSWVVRENTMASSGNQVLNLYDSTATANRLFLEISGWTNGEPTVVATTGTYLGSRYIGNGYWAVYGLETGVLSANTNEVRVQPANTTSATGKIDLYRANAVNSDVPSFSILSASETRNADVVYANFEHPPQAMTVYVKMLEGGMVNATNGTIFHIGSAAGTGAKFQVKEDAGNGVYELVYGDGTTNRQATLAAAPSFGDTVEFRATLSADGAPKFYQSVNGAAETSDTAEPALTLPTAWDDTRLYIGSQGTTQRGVCLCYSLKVARGVKSLAAMRAL